MAKFRVVSVDHKILSQMLGLSCKIQTAFNRQQSRAPHMPDNFSFDLIFRLQEIEGRVNLMNVQSNLLPHRLSLSAPFAHGFSNLWRHLMHTIPSLSIHLSQPRMNLAFNTPVNLPLVSSIKIRPTRSITGPLDFLRDTSPQSFIRCSNRLYLGPRLVHQSSRWFQTLSNTFNLTILGLRILISHGL